MDSTLQGDHGPGAHTRLKMSWQLSQPLDAIIFDCDGTLSSIEGIDEMAKLNDVQEEVMNITKLAMDQSGINPKVYQKRLDLVKPSLSQAQEISQKYIRRVVEDAQSVIHLLQSLSKRVLIFSAGISPSVRPFADFLSIAQEDVYCVDVFFDEKGQYLDYDHQSFLTQKDGKKELVLDLKKRYPRLALIGDGQNDLAAKDDVSRFIGFGGVYFRQAVYQKAPFYIHSPGLSPVLALCLTQEEGQRLIDSKSHSIYEKGIRAIESLKVHMHGVE